MFSNFPYTTENEVFDIHKFMYATENTSKISHEQKIFDKVFEF